MKLQCNGSDLNDAVGKVIKAVSVRSTNPVLEGVRMVAEDGSLTLSATDLELAIEHVIKADVAQKGETVVPGKLFSDFVKKLLDQDITLETTGTRLKIKYSNSEGEFGCYPPSQFPEINKVEDTQHFDMKSSDFKDLVNKVSFSVCQDESHPNLKGVLFEVNAADVTTVALDGYRLAKCVKPLLSTTAETSLVVPVRALMEISKLLPQNDDKCAFYIHKNYLMARVDATTITTRLIDGEFINYRQIIPQNFDTNVYIPKALFEDAIDRAALMTRSEKNNYLVRFDIDEVNMAVKAKSDMGNIDENIPVKTEGAGISISFNARYFSEFLRCVDDNTIVLKLTNSTSACILSPASDEEYIYLVLPVRNML